MAKARDTIVYRNGSYWWKLKDRRLTPAEIDAERHNKLVRDRFKNYPKAQAEGQEDHAIMQKMMNDLVQSRQIPNRRYSYDEMHQILDARKAKRQAKQSPPQQAGFGTYFVVGMIAIVVLFLYWWFTRGG